MGQRLYFKRHYQEGGNSDPMLILTDGSGDELAANDDYYFGDPLLHHRFEKDGEYFITVRDVDYGGAAHFTYAARDDRSAVRHGGLPDRDPTHRSMDRLCERVRTPGRPPQVVRAVESRITRARTRPSSSRTGKRQTR